MSLRLYNSHMVRTWHALLAILWPPNTAPAGTGTRTSPGIHQGTQYLVPYKDPVVQTLIKWTKYHADRRAARQLASYLDQYLEQLPTTYAIIPMPISYQRWRTRGYSQLELICQHSRYADTVRTDILKKSRHTKPQTHVSKTERIQQQQGTFSCHLHNSQVLPRTVLLLDDVVTTGATMAAARAALQPHLPPHTTLICLAIAH